MAFATVNSPPPIMVQLHSKETPVAQSFDSAAIGRSSAVTALRSSDEGSKATRTGVWQGGVWADIDGERKVIATRGAEATNAWILGGGKLVAYATPDGAGGYENEGQALRVYDVDTGKTKKVLAEYFHIDKMNSVRLSDGRVALLAAMSDGGLGADHFAVVDPTRGEVYRARMSLRMGNPQGDFIDVGHFKAQDYEQYPPDLSHPYEVSRLDLKEVLNRDIIILEPTN